MTSRGAYPVVIALLLVLAALFLTRSVMEPVAFALFVVALAAPLQGRLRQQMPGGLALLATVVVTLAVLAKLGLTIFWGVGEIGHWVVGNIGPLVVVALMTVFSAAQFGQWQTPLRVLITVTAAQFVIGSYLEPILAGAALTMSPFIVLFAVFFWGLLWRIPGAFLGVPIVILLLTVCEQLPGSRWVADLLAGAPPKT